MAAQKRENFQQLNTTLAIFFLRFGLAFVFSFAAVMMSLDPAPFIKYVPSIITEMFPNLPFFHILGVFEILLSLWLLSGKFIFYAATVSALLLFFIVLLNLESINVLFRNVAIFFAALALASLSK